MKVRKSPLDLIAGPIARAYIHRLSRARLPQVEGQVRVKGLRGPVEVLRDRWGIPHIHALYTVDAVFAQGYTHAQERLWQMDLNRRVVQGRVSEVIGPAGLNVDRTMRTLGLRRVAEQEALTRPDHVFKLVQAYCAGVNAWIESASSANQLPVEFKLLGYHPEVWTPADSHSISKLMGWILAANWQSEFLRWVLIQRIGPEKVAALEVDTIEGWAAILEAAAANGKDAGPRGIDPSQPFTGAQAADGAGSNNWVVHGSRTTTGKPLLANDMHLELTAPAIWFENHLVSDDLEITGVSIPGIPMVVSGHNRHVAWGFTDGLADVQDLYEEHLRTTEDGRVEYEFAGIWEQAEVRREEIRVKGAPTVTQEVIITCHGPVINILFEATYPDMPPLSLRWTALEPENNFEAFYDMNTARNCAELYQAVSMFDGPSQNVVFADTNGDIGYTLSGRIPLRETGDGSTPMPGWTGKNEWLGSIAFEELPHVLNPASGFVATANNRHARSGDDYFIGRDYFSSARAARIIELLEARDRVDVAYIQKMHVDQLSVNARAAGQYLGALQVSDASLADVVRLIKDWDGTLASNSPQAAIYEATMRQAVNLVLRHHLGESMGQAIMGKGAVRGLWRHNSWEWFVHLLRTPASPWFDLGHGEGRDTVLEKALRLAVDLLKKELGSDMQKWSWGRLNQLTFQHALGAKKPLDAAFNVGPFPIGGDGNTIWAAFSSLLDLTSGPTAGPPFRFIADMGDIEHCWGVLAPGQSGHPASPHYRDGAAPWLNNQYHPILFRWDEIQQHTRTILELLPGDKGYE